MSRGLMWPIVFSVATLFYTTTCVVLVSQQHWVTAGFNGAYALITSCLVGYSFADRSKR
jgi:hypothetical protein